MAKDTCIATSQKMCLILGRVMRREVLGVEQIRRWGNEEKLGIVMLVGVDSATVTHIA